MADQPLVWIGASRRDLLEFPSEARRRVGFELRVVQRGENPSDFKPMPIIGSGAYEIRIQAGGAFRVFYVTKFDEGCLCPSRVPKENSKHLQARHRHRPTALQRSASPP